MPPAGRRRRIASAGSTPISLATSSRSRPAYCGSDFDQLTITRDELAARWAATNGALQEAFDRFTAADWTARHTAVSEADFAANPLRNRLSVVLNRAAHVSYHLGQAALAPK